MVWVQAEEYSCAESVSVGGDERGGGQEKRVVGRGYTGLGGFFKDYTSKNG